MILVHNNYLSGGIAPFLGNFSLLDVISAGGNIPYSLGQLKYLSAIVSQSIYNLSSITTYVIYGSLPSNIGLLLPQLQMLQMSSNNFSGSIPVSLSNASKLQQIYLDDNIFNGKVNIDFEVLQHFVWLSLWANNLGNKGDSLLNFIPSLLNYSNLKMVDISYNQFKGVLSDFVGNLSSSIEQLSMQFNQISGSLPLWLLVLVNLQHLNIAHNLITSTIPIESGKLTRLQRLRLENCMDQFLHL